MKLVDLLLEIHVPDAKYGYWILPTGQMMPVNGHQAHEEVATDYLSRIDRFSNLRPDPDSDSFWTVKALKFGMTRVIANFDNLEFEWDYKNPSKRAFTSMEGIIRAYNNPGMNSITINNEYFKSARQAFAYLKSESFN